MPAPYPMDEGELSVQALAEVQQLLRHVAAGNIVKLPRDSAGNLTDMSEAMADICNFIAEDGLHTLYSM